jgi:hypothetical protein
MFTLAYAGIIAVNGWTDSYILQGWDLNSCQLWATTEFPDLAMTIRCLARVIAV